MSSSWNHNICLPCWTKARGAPDREIFEEGHRDTCCWCGTENGFGIYVRHDPKQLRCYGDHNARAES